MTTLPDRGHLFSLHSLPKEHTTYPRQYPLAPVVTFFFPPMLQQAKAEQEEEFISNTLLKEIHSLKKEKERLAMNYEQEEEYLTNDLSRKLFKVITLL